MPTILMRIKELLQREQEVCVFKALNDCHSHRLAINFFWSSEFDTLSNASKDADGSDMGFPVNAEIFIVYRSNLRNEVSSGFLIHSFSNKRANTWNQTIVLENNLDITDRNLFAYPWF